MSAVFEQLLSKSGAGADPIDLPIPIDFPTADDTRWSVGVFGGLPLYAGGANRAAKRRAQEELYQLQIERNAVITTRFTGGSNIEDDLQR